MGQKKGFFGRTNKTNDKKLVERVKRLLASKEYQYDHMTELIERYLVRYDKICSLTDKMRFHMKKHLEIHENEIDEPEIV